MSFAQPTLKIASSLALLAAVEKQVEIVEHIAPQDGKIKAGENDLEM